MRVFLALAVLISSSLFVSTAAAKNQITYENVIFEHSISIYESVPSQLLFTINGFRIDGKCYHNCDISFSLFANPNSGSAYLKLTQDLMNSRISRGSTQLMFIGNRGYAPDARSLILAFSEREKLALAWIIEHSAELISFANATDRISPNVADFWRGQEEVFPARVEKVFSTVLQGYKGSSETRNTNDHASAIIQPALAKLGLYSGPIDGVAGPVTRTAVSAFQTERGRLVTGYADSEEREMLAQVLKDEEGGEVLSQIAQLQATIDTLKRLSADRAEIIRALRVELHQARVELRRARASSRSDPETEASAELRRQLEAANATIADLQAESVPRSELERLEERLVTIVTTLDPASPAAELPTFDAPTTPMSASISEHCNSINVLTSTNGGFTTLGAMTNPAFVLNEQFCLARTAAVAQAERAMGNVVDVTPAQLSAQCDGLGALMRPTLAALQDDDPADVINDVQATLTGSGQSMEQLASAGVVCLGLGYQADKAEVALGSALLMVGTGHSAYGEIVAHQLRGGFGTEHCEACAGAWLTATIASLEGGATPAFLPNQSADRIALLKAASLGLGAPTNPSAGALPTFGASD